LAEPIRTLKEEELKTKIYIQSLQSLNAFGLFEISSGKCPEFNLREEEAPKPCS
jgi:hypothetical protein